MQQSNKKLLLLLLINILLISVHSYSLTQNINDEFTEIGYGVSIQKKVYVENKQTYNFKLIREQGDSAALNLTFTSDGGQESFYFFTTFDDVIAQENQIQASTPMSLDMCLPHVFSFSFQIDNWMSGGDIIITVKGVADDSKCYQYTPTASESEGSIHLSPYNVSRVTSSASKVLNKQLIIPLIVLVISCFLFII